MSTLAHYQALRSNQQTRENLGCALPELNGATLICRSQTCTAEQLQAALASWHNAQGWYQTHNCTALGMPESLVTLIEGEWFDGKRSLALRLLGPDQYLLTEMGDESCEFDDFFYQDQPVWLRGNLSTASVNCAIYRQWFERKAYAYQPVVSQFIGFNFYKVT